MDEIIKLIAKYLILLPVIVNIYIFWKIKKDQRKMMLILLVGGGLLSLLLAKLGSHFYNDPRPFVSDGSIPLFGHSRDNGFPSDHTLLASFLALVALHYSRALGCILLASAVLIGWARVAAHVHHATDIIGSFIITVAAYALVKAVVNKRYAGHKSK